MAKTIKFNLILDGNPVRTIEGLRENFSIEDILGYYENGLLSRWLKVRGFEEELIAVERINVKDSNKNKIKQLVKIFCVETDNAVIEESLKIIEYSKSIKELNNIYDRQKYNKDKIIEGYHKGYDALVKNMLDNNTNMAALKANAKILENEYSELFRLDNVRLYNRLLENAPKAIFALLMNNVFREIWLGNEVDTNVFKSIGNDLLRKEKAKQILGDDLKIINRDTDGVFDEIVPSNKNVMVITIDSGAFARGVDSFGEKLSTNEINGKLPVLKGLMYNCTSKLRELLYVEV